MNIIRLNDLTYAHSIQAIFNDAIENTTALYEYESRSLPTVETWLNNKFKNNRPVFAAIENNQLLGFTSYDSFRPYAANLHTVELALYVDKHARGKGIASMLLGELIDFAKQDNVHVMIAGIDEDNTVSIALHKKFGFSHSGTLKEVAYKFNRWLNLAFYQKNLRLK